MASTASSVSAFDLSPRGGGGSHSGGSSHAGSSHRGGSRSSASHSGGSPRRVAHNNSRSGRSHTASSRGVSHNSSRNSASHVGSSRRAAYAGGHSNNSFGNRSHNRGSTYYNDDHNSGYYGGSYGDHSYSRRHSYGSYAGSHSYSYYPYSRHGYYNDHSYGYGYGYGYGLGLGLGYGLSSFGYGLNYGYGYSPYYDGYYSSYYDYYPSATYNTYNNYYPTSSRNSSYYYPSRADRVVTHTNRSYTALASAPAYVVAKDYDDQTFGIGWSYLAGGRDRSAFRYFSRQASRNIDDGQSKLGYAIASAFLDNHDRAIWAMRRAFDVDPYSLSTIQFDEKLLSRIDRLAEEYAKLADAGNDPDADFMLSALSYLLKDSELASIAIDSAIGQGDDSDAAINLKSMITEIEPAAGALP